MTQKEMVIAYLKEHGSITPLEAMTELGIMRLSPRIGEIQNELPTVTITEKGKNRYGKTTHYARYVIRDKVMIKEVKDGIKENVQ